jgi:hypothetical protein
MMRAKARKKERKDNDGEEDLWAITMGNFHHLSSIINIKI